MAFYLLTINKSNNSLISAKKKIRKISLFRFLIKQWRQHPGKGRYLPELPHRPYPQGYALQHARMFQQEVLFCPWPWHRGHHPAQHRLHRRSSQHGHHRRLRPEPQGEKHPLRELHD